jgi:glucokinase
MIRTLAIDIGGTNFSVGIFEDESLIAKCTTPTDRSAGPLWMMERMQEIVSELAPKGKFDRCGIGFGGPVDFAKQEVFFSTQVQGWDGFELIREVESRFQTRAVVDRDTMVGALGEGFYGAGRDTRPLFYITISTGVGGGLLTEHGLYRGYNSYACELGHSTVLTDGPLCLCGSYGCMERMCSGLWLERDYGAPAEVLLQSPEFVKKYAVYLAQGLKNTIMLLNPAMIVIGGGISNAGDSLFQPLREELRVQMPGWSKAVINVQPPALRGDSVLWGALRLAQDSLGLQLSAPTKATPFLGR